MPCVCSREKYSCTGGDCATTARSRGFSLTARIAALPSVRRVGYRTKTQALDLARRDSTLANIAEYTLAQQGDATNVTWTMYGPSPYLSKLFGVFCSMDRTVGTKFEEGLANLKALAEK